MGEAGPVSTNLFERVFNHVLTAKAWPPYLLAIMGYSVVGFRGLLCHFTRVQRNCIEEPLETAGNPVYCSSFFLTHSGNGSIFLEVACNELDSIGVTVPLQRSPFSTPPV